MLQYATSRATCVVTVQQDWETSNLLQGKLPSVAVPLVSLNFTKANDNSDYLS